VSWAYARSARFSYLVVSCAYTRTPRRSRADVGPTLGPGTQLWVLGSPCWCREDPAAGRVGSEGLKQRRRQPIRRGVRGGSPALQLRALQIRRSGRAGHHFVMLTVIGAETVELPAMSLLIAVKVCRPMEAPCVRQVN
jgi:hypothetical protein